MCVCVPHFHIAEVSEVKICFDICTTVAGELSVCIVLSKLRCTTYMGNFQSIDIAI